MDQIELEVSTRGVLGKKVRFLRRKGITPVHVFGHGIESLTLQTDTERLRHSLNIAGETRLISLKVDNDATTRPVLVREVQKDAISGRLVHVDFYQVRMGEKVEVEVPVELVGEAPALDVKGNTLRQELEHLAVECLPGNIPNRIDVDISSIVEAGDAIRVKDIVVGADVTVLTDPDQVVVTVVSRPEEKAEEVEAPEEAAEQPTEGEQAEGESEKE